MDGEVPAEVCLDYLVPLKKGVKQVTLTSRRTERGPLRSETKVLAIKTVASQALFGTSDAARFLGISKDTLFRMRVGLRTVQELLGHSSITVTQRYAHFAQSHAQDEVFRVADLEAEISAQVEHYGIMVRQ